VTGPYKKLFEPLYGIKRPEAQKLVKKALKRSPKKAKIKESEPQPQVSPSLDGLKPYRQAAPIKSWSLGELAKDKKTLLILAIFVIILIVIGYLAFKQKKQNATLARLAKKLKRFK